LLYNTLKIYDFWGDLVLYTQAYMIVCTLFFPVRQQLFRYGVARPKSFYENGGVTRSAFLFHFVIFIQFFLLF
jgi:hypothetical protein